MNTLNKQKNIKKISNKNLYDFYSYMNEIRYLYDEASVYIAKRTEYEKHLHTYWEAAAKGIAINMVIYGLIFILCHIMIKDPAVNAFLINHQLYYVNELNILCGNPIFGLILVVFAGPFYNKIKFYAEFNKMQYVDAICEIEKDMLPVCQKIYNHFQNCPYKDVSAVFSYQYAHPLYAKTVIEILEKHPKMSIEKAIKKARAILE